VKIIMGMDVQLCWSDRPEMPDRWWELDTEAIAGTYGYMREQYGVSRDHSCELCPLIAEVFNPNTQVEKCDVSNAHIPAAVLRSRVPSAQERVRVRYANIDNPYSTAHLADIEDLVADKVKAIDAWVGLAERLEAQGVKPIIWAFT
jgi:hypothetical protein